MAVKEKNYNQLMYESAVLADKNETINGDLSFINEDIKDTEVDIDYEMTTETISTDLIVDDQMAAYLKQIASYPLLSEDDLLDLTRKARAGDDNAREKVFLHNLRLVVYVAKKYMSRTKTLSELDLIMEGNLGLLKAIDRYDPERGFKFSTYAFHWVRQAIQRAIMNDDNTIRIPIHANELLFRYIRCINQYHQEFLTEDMPPKEYVKKVLGCDDDDYINLVQTYEKANIDSLNRFVSTNVDDPTELIEFIEDENFDIFKPVANEELLKMIDDTIERFLTRSGSRQETCARNKDILHRRFGLHGYHIHTLDEVGKIYNITRERVRQVESTFIKFCRTGRTRYLLKQFLD